MTVIKVKQLGEHKHGDLLSCYVMNFCSNMMCYGCSFITQHAKLLQTDVKCVRIVLKLRARLPTFSIRVKSQLLCNIYNNITHSTGVSVCHLTYDEAQQEESRHHHRPADPPHQPVLLFHFSLLKGPGKGLLTQRSTTRPTLQRHRV